MIRRACTTLALLALFLQGASGGHMLLVEHTKCAEHRELVHDAHKHRIDLGTDAGRSLRGTSLPKSEASHDHCSFATERRDAVAPIVDARATGLVTIDVPDRFKIAQARSENTPRFRLAPKNSPPA